MIQEYFQNVVITQIRDYFTPIKFIFSFKIPL